MADRTDELLVLEHYPKACWIDTAEGFWLILPDRESTQAIGMGFDLGDAWKHAAQQIRRERPQ